MKKKLCETVDWNVIHVQHTEYPLKKFDITGKTVLKQH